MAVEIETRNEKKKKLVGLTSSPQNQFDVSSFNSVPHSFDPRRDLERVRLASRFFQRRPGELAGLTSF